MELSGELIQAIAREAERPGVGVRAVAHAAGVAVGTIYRWLEMGRLDREWQRAGGELDGAAVLRVRLLAAWTLARARAAAAEAAERLEQVEREHGGEQ